MNSRAAMKIFAIIFLIAAASVAGAQTTARYNYAAQKKFIPSELGKIYLGMPFDEFARQIDLKEAEIGDTRFEWFLVTVPFNKGNVESLSVKIHGLTAEDKARILRRETVGKKDEDGSEYEQEVDRLLTDRIPRKGFVYAMYIDFKEDFDLKTYAFKTFGRPKPGDVHKEGEYHFFDMQWTKRTSDGLLWLIRSFHGDDARTLQLLGRIDGTEWGLNM
jgi:hypothetical protein